MMKEFENEYLKRLIVAHPDFERELNMHFSDIETREISQSSNCSWIIEYSLVQNPDRQKIGATNLVGANLRQNGLRLGSQIFFEDGELAMLEIFSYDDAFTLAINQMSLDEETCIQVL